MDEKDKKIVELFRSIADTLYWIRMGDTDIKDNVNDIYKQLNELEKTMCE